IPPTRFILEPPVGGTEKPLFLLRALPQKNSDFAVLIADAVRLEPVEWRHPGAREPTRFRVPRLPGARAQPVQCQGEPCGFSTKTDNQPLAKTGVRVR